MDEAFTTSSKSGAVINAVRGLVGAALGGVAGYFLRGWILRQGMDAGILPGALLGLGCGVFVQRRNVLLAVVCGLSALALGIFAEWKYWPFVVDESFSFFIRHLFDKTPFKLVMLGLGGLAGFWFALGTGSVRYSKPKAESPEE